MDVSPFVSDERPSVIGQVAIQTEGFDKLVQEGKKIGLQQTQLSPKVSLLRAEGGS